jgi:adenosine deaminase
MSTPSVALPERTDGLDLRAMPKPELHRHLEGSIRLATIIDLSRDAGLELPAWTEQELAPHALITDPVADLEEALSRFGYAQNAVRTPEAVRRITVEAIEDLAAEHVTVAELRFSPEFLCEPGRLDWDEAFDAIIDGVQATAPRLGVRVGLIAIASRDYGVASAAATVAFALRRRDHLVGFDLAGPEVGYPPRLYADVLAPIHGSGLGLTVHYGESGGPEYPKEALEVLSPRRLGHGLSVAWDPDVTALVRERGVVLEMCPTSNWLTRGIAGVAEHPIRRLLLEEIQVTLNTDDPGIMGIDLTHEYETARNDLGFTDQELGRLAANGFAAVFDA